MGTYRNLSRDGSMMRRLSCGILGMAVLCGGPTAVAAQHIRVFNLSVDSGPARATFVIRDGDLFTRVGNESGWLFSTGSCMDIPGHPAVVSTYAQGDSYTSQWLEESRAMRTDARSVANSARSRRSSRAGSDVIISQSA